MRNTRSRRLQLISSLNELDIQRSQQQHKGRARRAALAGMLASERRAWAAREAALLQAMAEEAPPQAPPSQRTA